MSRRHALARLAVVAAALLLVISACNDDGGSDGPIFGTTATTSGGQGGSGTGQGGGSGTSQDGGSGSGDTSPGGSETGGGGSQDDSAAYTPLPLREGLGTFNSYEWHMEATTTGPGAGERNQVITDLSFNRDPKASTSTVRTVQEGPDFETPEDSEIQLIAVEGDTCQFDGDTWTFTGATDQQREVIDAVQRLLDFAIVPDNPTEIGGESIAGIPAVHYRYEAPNMGGEPGDEVTANQVDYWIAEGTRVLVQYTVLFESRNGNEVFRAEASATLQSADQPVAISLPADCLAARDAES